ncbi:MAG TPA: class I SAM-dependent methyltransferase [Acidimicrobiales bacterium]
MTVPAPYSSPAAWWAGPERVYEALSRGALAHHAAELEGRRVLDLGAGVGATSRVVGEAGGRPVALDASWPMLHHRRRRRPPSIVGDACALPLADHSVGATVAAFVLSHVGDPVTLLREAGRVTTPGGAVVAVSFARTETRPAVVGIVDGLLMDRGWRPPPWFRLMKDEREPVVADPDRLASMAGAAGLDAPEVVTRQVDTGIDDPVDLVAWRLGSPASAAFIAGLPVTERRRLRTEAVDRLGPSPQSLVLELRVLSSRAAATRRSVSA